MNIRLLDTPLAVCRLRAEDDVPSWIEGSSFSSVTRTTHELSIVCDQRLVPIDIESETDWRALMVDATLNFSIVGIIANLSSILSEAEISLFTISTFNTDYILVKADSLPRAIRALELADHQVK